MKWSRFWTCAGRRLFACAIVMVTEASVLSAQNPELQQKVAEAKEAVARNKQELAQYTWVEQVTISLKGEQKKQEHFQVRLGPDGKPQKQLPRPAAQRRHRSERRRGAQKARR